MSGTRRGLLTKVLAAATSVLMGSGLAVVATAPAAVAAPAGIFDPTPNADSFYHAHGDELSRPNGAVLRSRNVQIPLAPNAVATQLAFKTTGAQGEPQVGVTTVLKGANTPANAPVLSVQHYINALGAQCAPSVQLQTSATVLDPWFALSTAAVVQLALARGWAVNIPDHLGEKVAYPVGEVGAHVTLDSLRAVRDEPQLNAKGSKFALIGYSGGGVTSSFAAALHPSFAPDVNLVGSAEGGIIPDFEDMAVKNLNVRHPVFGLAFAAGIGFERAYPGEFAISDKLNERGLELVNQMRNACTNEILAYGTNISADDVKKPGLEILGQVQEISVLHRGSLSYRTENPTTPLFVWHSPNDPLAPYGKVREIVDRYCANGVTVQMYNSSAPEHLAAAAEGIPAALAFVEARFSGQPPISTC